MAQRQQNIQTRRKETRRIELDPRLLALANDHRSQVLAYLAMRMLGTPLSTICAGVIFLCDHNLWEFGLACIVAHCMPRMGVVQIPGLNVPNNVIMNAAFRIDGQREGLRAGDNFNYGSMVAAGALLCTMAPLTDVGKQSLAKAGNMIFGGGFTDNEAGDIKKEAQASWAAADIAAWREWLGGEEGLHQSARVQNLFNWIPAGAGQVSRALMDQPPNWQFVAIAE